MKRPEPDAKEHAAVHRPGRIGMLKSPQAGTTRSERKKTNKKTKIRGENPVLISEGRKKKHDGWLASGPVYIWHQSVSDLRCRHGFASYGGTQVASVTPPWSRGVFPKTDLAGFDWVLLSERGSFRPVVCRWLKMTWLVFKSYQDRGAVTFRESFICGPETPWPEMGRSSL